MLSITDYNNSTRSSSQELFTLDQNRYERYAQKKGWKFEVVDITESDLKGYKVISLSNFLVQQWGNKPRVHEYKFRIYRPTL